jgi:hypothetical protein
MPRSSSLSVKRLPPKPNSARLAVVFGDQLDLDAAIIGSLALATVLSILLPAKLKA